MRKSLIYVYLDIEEHEITYTGIRFFEFIKYFNIPIENILLLKSDYIGDKNYKRFELVEGKERIEFLAQKDIHTYGDFCFIDYSDNKIELLTEQQIAELLFLAHMFRPLKSPFFHNLNNNVVYLAHDDGFFTKVYLRNTDTFKSVLNCKIINMIEKKINTSVGNIPVNIQEKLLELTKFGLLLDSENIIYENGEILVKLFLIGKQQDMDYVINSSLKKRAADENKEEVLLSWQLKHKEPQTGTQGNGLRLLKKSNK